MRDATITNSAAKPVEIRSGDQKSLRKILAQLRDQIRKRAFELFCQRAACGADKADWLQAERETALSHIAGIEDSVGDIRITAAVPDMEPSRLVVDVLPDSIVLEGKSARAPSTTKYSVFPLPAHINASAVKAELRNGFVTVVAPKAEVAEPEVAKATSELRPAGCSGKCAPGTGCRNSITVSDPN
jgi:HSP20 family molecular chaperone IbpA